MSKTLVYSCVTGNYDDLLSAVLASVGAVEKDVRYVLYTDKVQPDSNIFIYTAKHSDITWELHPLLWQHPSCPRRTARWHKINSHLLPGSHKYTIWLDGSQRIKKIPLASRVLASVPKNTLLAAFKHPHRSCVYEETSACMNHKKDDPALLKSQAGHYRKEGYPEGNGLVETGCVLRKNCTEVANFNKNWWQQLEKFSSRDQMGFNYAAWQTGISYHLLPGSGTKSEFFDYVKHKRREVKATKAKVNE